MKTIQQPTIRPRFDTRATVDVLLEAARALGANVPAGNFRELLFAAWGGKPAMDIALARGGEYKDAPAANVGLASGVGSLDFEPAPLSGNASDPVLVVYPSLHLYDGRLSRVQALHEIPDPVTKTMWGSYAELHPETATVLDVEMGDVLEISTDAGKVRAAGVPASGGAPGVIALQVGAARCRAIPTRRFEPPPAWQRTSSG